MLQALTSLQLKQQMYRKVLVEEFIREFNFLIDVAADRAAPKADFTDKIIAVFNSVVNMALGQVPLPGIGFLCYGIEIAIDWAKVSFIQKEEDNNDYITQLQHSIDQTQLRILLELVALEASRRYEFAIATKLSDVPTEAIIPFAKAGVNRMLEYVVREKRNLTYEILLEGLIRGHSGAYVNNGVNTKLASNDSSPEKNLTAEGIYGRSAFMTFDKVGTDYNYRYWVLRDKNKARHKSQNGSQRFQGLLSPLNKLPKKETFFNYGYVKFAAIKGDFNNNNNNNNKVVDAIKKLEKQAGKLAGRKPRSETDPKYGYVVVPKKVVEHYLYDEEQSFDNLSGKLQETLSNSLPTIQIITREHIENYLTAIQSGEIKGSFNNFMRGTYPSLLMTIYLPDEAAGLDLSDLNFEGADFSDCILNGCTFKGSFKNTRFDRTYLVGADLTGITNAQDASFNGANLAYVKAEQANLSGANFTNAKLDYGTLIKAKLHEIEALGASWFKADLTDIEISKTAKIDEIRREQEVLRNELQEQQQNIRRQEIEHQKQDKQFHNIITGINDAIIKLQQNNSLLEEEQAKKLQELSANLIQEKASREAFIRYCQGELRNLSEGDIKLNNMMKEQEQQIKLLKEQLMRAQDTQEQSQVQLTQVILTVNELVKKINNKDSVQQPISQLDAQIQSYIKERSTDIEQLYKRLDNIRFEIGKIDYKVNNIEERVSNQDERIAILENKTHTQTKSLGKLYFQIGRFHEHEKSYGLACQAYEESIAQGYITAYANAGTLYLDGPEGFAKNLNKAYEYLLQAANHGHARAMFNLGRMFEYGQGVSKDSQKALYWYEKALRHSVNRPDIHKAAQGKIDKLNPTNNQQVNNNYIKPGFFNNKIQDNNGQRDNYFGISKEDSNNSNSHDQIDKNNQVQRRVNRY